MAVIETMKVKSWGKDQEGFTLINKSDFDKEIHEAYEAKASKPKTTDEYKAALEGLKIEIPEGAKKAELVALYKEAIEEVSPE